MKTYRNEQLGFEIDLPEDWSLPTGDMVDGIGCRPDEAIQFVIGPPLPELLPDFIEREFTRYAQSKGYTNLEFGRISVGGKQHVWARYHEGRNERTKKYMLAFGGIQYVITTTGANQRTFDQREKIWDAMVGSFRLSKWRERDILKQKDHRIETAGQLYEKAYEAVAEGHYFEARNLLERCLSDDPNHILAHKELAVVLKKINDIRGAVSHRKEVKRLDPSDTVNRFNLADLLTGLGAKVEALQELEELLKIDPRNSMFQAARLNLMNTPPTLPQHSNDETQQQFDKKQSLVPRDSSTSLNGQSTGTPQASPANRSPTRPQNFSSVSWKESSKKQINDPKYSSAELNNSLNQLSKADRIVPPLAYPQYYYEESRLEPGQKRNLKLIDSSEEKGKYGITIRLVYHFENSLSYKEASGVERRTCAYITCAIYDAAINAGLRCQASELLNGRRPSWVINDERISISVIKIVFNFVGNTYLIEIGPSMLGASTLQGGGVFWAKLLEGFKNTFSNISV